MTRWWRWVLVCEWEATPALTCCVCGYSLAGLTLTRELRCPECGTLAPAALSREAGPRLAAGKSQLVMWLSGLQLGLFLVAVGMNVVPWSMFLGGRAALGRRGMVTLANQVADAGRWPAYGGMLVGMVMLMGFRSAREALPPYVLIVLCGAYVVFWPRVAM